MKKRRPKTPYERLLEDIRRYVFNVTHRRRTTMWVYPKDKLFDDWDLKALYDRVAAAEQIGYAVELNAEGKGLRVVYVEPLPKSDWKWN